MLGRCVRASSKRSRKTDRQVSELTNWLETNGHDPAKVTWCEDHETGKTNRKGFARLQQDIFAGKIECVLLWKLDRLSRRLLDGINTLAEETLCNPEYWSAELATTQ